MSIAVKATISYTSFQLLVFASIQQDKSVSAQIHLLTVTSYMIASGLKMIPAGQAVQKTMVKRKPHEPSYIESQGSFEC